MSALSQIAKDPSCLLAVDALQGGRWLSCIRPGGVQPSSVPRDFAEETKTWYDFQNMQLAADWTHDYTFECTFMLHTRDNSAPVLYVDAQRQMFGVYQYSDNTIGLFTTLFKPTASAGKYLAYIITTENATIFWESYHTVKIVVNGNSTSFYIDNELIRTFSSNYERTPKVDLNLAAPTTKTGYIGNCFIQDDTTGKIVWSYPTWEERTRLLTFANVATSGGVFRAADATARWNVKTPLRWRNLTAATIIAQTTVNDFPETVFSFGMPSNPNDSVILLRRSSENQLYASLLGTRADGSAVYRTMTVDFPFVSGEKYVFALVFDIDGDFMRLYANGELLASAEVRPLVAIAADGPTLPGFMLGTTSNSDAVNSGSSVSAALIFDRALTQPEIAAISNTMG